MRVLLDRRPLLDVSVRGTNPAIPHALEAIVAKCLAVSPDDRYPDAGALAEDLDAFLEQKPLVHAVNPSRRERCVNWTIRNKMWVRMVAAGLAVFTLGMAAERWRTSGRPSGPIESSRDLIAAMEAIDQGRPVDAVETLKKLSDWYPHSCLPTVYLSFAYDACKQESDAEACFQRVLESPSGTNELVTWVGGHPELRARLKRFADRRDERAKFYKRRETLVGSEREHVLRAEYMLAKRALEFSREGEVDPESEADPDSTNFKLATFEDGVGEFEAACKRADEAIKWHRAHSGADNAAQIKIEKSVFPWRWLRGRSATELADQLRKEGTKDGAEGAVQHLLLAEDDLRQCRRYMSSFETITTDKHLVEGIWVNVLLTRTETELDLGHLGKAVSYLKSTTNAMRTYRALCLLVEGREPSYLAPVQERLSQVSRRLEEARKVPHENKIQPADQNVAAGLPKGVDLP